MGHDHLAVVPVYSVSLRSSTSLDHGRCTIFENS